MGQVNCCRGFRDDPDPVQQCVPVPASQERQLRQSRAKAGAEHQPPPLVSSGIEGGVGHSAGGTNRRRRRWLPWPFAQRGTSDAAEAAEPSGSGHTGVLFGWPLAALCSKDGSLPQPIQDLLALLQEHGPSTEGIFRLAAGERASRELREALDSGAPVQLESQPVHLLASILKEFLRKIPSKLLQAELYQDWMSALQNTSREERLAGLKDVTSKLPEPNLLLLKQLLTLLHTISSNTSTSRMSAANLAICVGPNLLSPPEEDSLPLEALVQVTGKVTQLVEFLIDHHEELFEEEEAGLTGASAEELPAPEPDAEASEVPPVTLESEHLNSTSEERRLPGSSRFYRKRKPSCEEQSDGQPERKRRKLATEH